MPACLQDGGHEGVAEVARQLAPAFRRAAAQRTSLALIDYKDAADAAPARRTRTCRGHPLGPLPLQWYAVGLAFAHAPVLVATFVSAAEVAVRAVVARLLLGCLSHAAFNLWLQQG
jgi:hypothetical protein